MPGADVRVGDLQFLPYEDESFDVVVFSELIEHHVDEEEDEMFKTAKKLGAAELNALGDRMAAQVEKVKGPGATRRRRAA